MSFSRYTAEAQKLNEKNASVSSSSIAGSVKRCDASSGTKISRFFTHWYTRISLSVSRTSERFSSKKTIVLFTFSAAAAMCRLPTTIACRDAFQTGTSASALPQ